jgi:hypothetical protein
MGKVRRGGYVFLSYVSDHGPRHVHVYRDGRLIVKWDLDHGVAMKGKASPNLKGLIRQLQAEGRL